MNNGSKACVWAESVTVADAGRRGMPQPVMTHRWPKTSQPQAQANESHDMVREMQRLFGFQ